MNHARSAKPRALFKTEIVIWWEYPGDTVALSRLAQDAEADSAYYAVYRSALVTAPDSDRDWDGTDFLGPAMAGALLLCDGCLEAATGLLAGCAVGCAQPTGHGGECLREGPAVCQWCGLPGRLHAVSRAAVDGLLPYPGEDGDGLWFLHWDDRYQGPYPSRDAAWAGWHAAGRPPRPEDPARQGAPPEGGGLRQSRK